MSKIHFKNKINVLSLFSNVGIAETYFSELGLEVKVANEIIEKRSQFYHHLYPNVDIITGDITDTDIFQSIIDKSKNQKIDFIIATPPCQGMSCAGKKTLMIQGIF